MSLLPAVIYTKGKGDVQTYWLAVANRGSESSSQKHSVPSDDVAKPLEIEHFPVNKKRDPKTNRLVRWSEDVLVRLLKQIVARRKVTPLLASERSPPNEARYLTMTTNSPVEEIKKSIVLPRFKQVDSPVDPDDVVLDLVVVHQLREFLEQIAAAHRAHDFHNFEHASHVAMSVVKLLSRIVDPPELKENRKDKKEAASSLHNFTYGIASDPLAQFTCVLAALVHEVDHPGVPNTQLLNERHELASRYMNKSITEQNAIHISWKLLFKKEFDLLRATIYGTDAELVRFRQIMVNSVLATDLYDSDLKLARIQCWERSFSQTALHSDSNELSNRKATIVIEFLLQASDISHTMQHWHVYRKWNERFFLEQYQAFVDKRADKDPATDWYEKEIEFFDFYVIPLAQKLKDCVVFGVSSEEYLNYAVRNRKEWEKRGRDMVHEMVDRLSGR